MSVVLQSLDDPLGVCVEEEGVGYTRAQAGQDGVCTSKTAQHLLSCILFSLRQNQITFWEKSKNYQERREKKQVSSLKSKKILYHSVKRNFPD